ncbi:hypothetical protein ASF61_12700 [Duganella sp. Leaf126]|uniref:LysR family transcriptional regulator n=1 Tax=Duganella sp. Leaf126 TaxID=1736266 RepID=UPI0006FB7A9F|nr:LysR family transcriptional regulator [Duganella sp. Leaf126]KQQ32947.1 hypothetical protein ASF61_12700 [Duganella sp. Leaf126]
MKNITLRQFRIFESVARNLSFSRAAEDLHLTQPAVSMQIKQMEGLAGLPLFRQTGKRIALTDGGRVVLRHCQVILADLRAAEQSLAGLLENAADQPRQRLRVGLITSGSCCFPQLIRAFLQNDGQVHHAGHDIDLELTVRSRDQLVAMLRCDALDLALMLHPPELGGVTATPFADNPFVLVAPALHPLADARQIPVARLAAECLIVREPGTDTRQVADDTLLRPGARAQYGLAAAPRFMELGCSEAIRQTVMAGMGIGLLSAREVQADLLGGRLRVLDVQGFPVMQRWHAVHRGLAALPRAARDFHGFLLAEGAARLADLAPAPNSLSHLPTPQSLPATTAPH